MLKGIYSLICFAIPVIMFIQPSIGHSQNNKIHISMVGGQKISEIPSVCSSEMELALILEKVKKKYLNMGYLGFSVDTLFSDTAIHLSVHKGDRFLLHPFTIDPPGFEHLLPKIKNAKPYSQNKVDNVEQSLIKKLNKQGYAKARLEKSTTLNNQTIAIHYTINPGEKIYTDTLFISPTALIHPDYLIRKTGMLPNQIFQVEKFEKLKQNIDQTGVMILDSSYVILQESNAKVHLFVHPQKNNQFSGIVGMTTNENHKLEFTGDVDLQLVNLLKHGEQIFFSWKHPAQGSQNLDAHFKIPYLLSTPLGIMARAGFEKLDSSYSNTLFEAGAIVELIQNGTITLKYQWNHSSVTPSNLGIFKPGESNLYGLDYKYQRFNHQEIPSQGTGIFLSVLVGNQMTEKATNNEQKSLIAEIQGQFEWMYPVFFGSILLKSNSSFKINDSLPFNNFYRVGGFNSMEGFQEKSIASREYSFFTTEYHIPINETSMVRFFYQLGWFNESKIQSHYFQTRQSFGAGLNLGTPAGRLSLSFAIGKAEKQMFRFDQGKLHIGYTHRF